MVTAVHDTTRDWRLVLRHPALLVSTHALPIPQREVQLWHGIAMDSQLCFQVPALVRMCLRVVLTIAAPLSGWGPLRAAALNNTNWSGVTSAIWRGTSVHRMTSRS